jgi:hypothetical protein
MSGSSDLIVFQQWEQTLGDLLDRTSKFPKSVRFTLSGRIDNLALDIIEALVAARYSKGRCRVEYLREIDSKLTRLRVLLRVVHGRGYLNPKGYEHTSRRVDEAGRMVGAWLRSTASGVDAQRLPKNGDGHFSRDG